MGDKIRLFFCEFLYFLPLHERTIIDFFSIFNNITNIPNIVEHYLKYIKILCFLRIFFIRKLRNVDRENV